MNDRDLTLLVKSFDAAPHAEVSDDVRERAAARKAEIIATAEPAPLAPALGTRRSRRWALAVTGLAAASVTGLFAADALAPAPAYASWTPTPTAVTSAELAIAADACTTVMGETDADVILAERRGDWIGLAAVTPNPLTISCMLYLPTGATRAEHVSAAASGGQGAVPTGGQFTEGSISEFSGRGLLGIRTGPPAAFNVGDVGPGVTAVDITTADGELVHATVEDGRFIAWWPGRAFGDETEGNGGPAPDLSYRITLTDGTVIEDAQPVLP